MPVAIVTGSVQGIDKTIAFRLSNDGFDVVIADMGSKQPLMMDVVTQITSKGKKAHWIEVDVSKQDEVEALVAKTVKVFGELNVMVANAGILDTTGILEISLEAWERTMSVNVRGIFLCHRTAARQMIKQGKRGKLIAASSISGYRPSGKAPAYCTSKWAVRGLTQTCALELGQHGITANSYCPGSVPTPMSLQFAERLGKEQGITDPEEMYKKSSHRTSALPVDLETEDIAALVSFLAGKDSNRITGQSLICDGGKCYSLKRHRNNYSFRLGICFS
ncbi:acetoin reductase [Pyrenophora seminiperda CCB06]|uniref:Acetoin reductase n=1 Tax=Pyrenophora seminiperda CCB06 TaxID=1302712 RepID=A0A3M7M1K3_9PLEO|nr:acetoin reductase [Pyrenophora seminiperda CCB06]